jgi:ferredoxin-NADP reductase
MALLSDAPTIGADAFLRDHLAVEAVTRISSDVVEIRLAHPEGATLPEWGPGDHIDIEFGSGLTRQYSLCGTRDDRGTWTIAVRRDAASRGGSQFAHERLTVGDVVRVAGPRRRFALEDAPHHVLVAGGIGITPILTMAEHLAAEGRPFRLVYFDRGVDRMVFGERLTALGEFVTSVDRAVDETLLAEFMRELPEGALVYACGPKRMLEELRELVPAHALRVEDFAPEAGRLDSDAGQSGDAAETDEFEVQLGANGDVLPVPSGCSLLDVLLEAGIDVMWSCREGNCASCETNVLEGIPDHRDVILTEDEKAANDVMFPCVSRAKSARLVLDV